MNTLLPVGKKAISLVTTRNLPVYFLKDEINIILQHLSERKDKLGYVAMSCMWQTGCRVSECIALKVNDIDFRNSQLKIRTLKKKSGYLERIVPLKPQLLGELAIWIQENGLKSDDRLFPVSRVRIFQIVKDAVLRCGFDVRRAHPHTLRHSFAVHCVLNNVPILVVKEWLGHSSITTTLVYLKVIARDTRQF